MKIENPVALRFIIDDDIYLLAGDKAALQTAVNQPVTEPVAIRPALSETVIGPAPQLPVLQPELETPVFDFKYKGGNKKNFLVLVHYTDADFMADAHLTALENILKRKELGLDDVAILNLAQYSNQNKKNLLDFFKPQRLLLMGKNALPADFPAPIVNQLTQTDGIKTLYSFSFAEMMDSNDNKKAFWDQMKNL